MFKYVALYYRKNTFQMSSSITMTINSIVALIFDGITFQFESFFTKGFTNKSSTQKNSKNKNILNGWTYRCNRIIFWSFIKHLVITQKFFSTIESTPFWSSYLIIVLLGFGYPAFKYVCNFLCAFSFLTFLYFFLSSGQFASTGRLMTGTKCDYQFLSSSGSSSSSSNRTISEEGRFFSPHYPASYPHNIKCAYIFYARWVELVRFLSRFRHATIKHSSWLSLCGQRKEKCSLNIEETCFIVAYLHFNAKSNVFICTFLAYLNANLDLKLD